MQAKKHTCPNCSSVMEEVNIHSHYGAPIFLEQCKQCGGLWFDDLELYRAKHGEAERIDAVDEKRLAQNVNIQPELYCPKDKTKLKVFKDPNFPEQITVESCPTCSGFWLNRGEFSAFQDERKKRWGKPGGQEQEARDRLSKQIEGMLALSSNSDRYNTVGQLGNFLMQPAMGSKGGGFVLNMDRNETGSGGSAWSGIIVQVLFQVLKLIFRGLGR